MGPTRSDSVATKQWLPANGNMEAILELALQCHPIGKLASFPANTLVAVQQNSLTGKMISPHLSNCGDTATDSKEGSSATSYTEPPATHIGSSRRGQTFLRTTLLSRRSVSRPQLVNTLVESTTFTLTIHTSHWWKVPHLHSQSTPRHTHKSRVLNHYLQ